MNQDSRVCHKIDVPLTACLLRFGPPSKVMLSCDPIGTTVRNEMIVAEFDAVGRILSLELVGDGKPCQD